MNSINNALFPSLTFAALLVMLTHIPVTFAADTDTDTSSINAYKDIQIRADHMKFDLETGSSIYQGAVKIVQGGIELSGDKVIIQLENDKIKQINVDGQPAQYIQDELTDNKIHATSQHMEYLATQNRLVMMIDARLEQPNHTIESQRIVYDTKNKVVIAGNDQDKQSQEGGRVNITLTPKKDKIETPVNTETNTESK